MPDLRRSKIIRLYNRIESNSMWLERKWQGAVARNKGMDVSCRVGALAPPNIVIDKIPILQLFVTRYSCTLFCRL